MAASESELETRLKLIAEAYKRSPAEAAQVLFTFGGEGTLNASRLLNFFSTRLYERDPRFDGFEILSVLEQYPPVALKKIGPHISKVLSEYEDFIEKNGQQPWEVLGLEKNFTKAEYGAKRKEFTQFHPDKQLSVDATRMKKFNDVNTLFKTDEGRAIVNLYHSRLYEPNVAPAPAPKPAEKPAAQASKPTPTGTPEMKEAEAVYLLTALSRLSASKDPHEQGILKSITGNSSRMKTLVEGLQQSSMPVKDAIGLVMSLTSSPDYLMWFRQELKPFMTAQSPAASSSSDPAPKPAEKPAAQASKPTPTDTPEMKRAEAVHLLTALSLLSGSKDPGEQSILKSITDNSERMKTLVERLQQSSLPLEEGIKLVTSLSSSPEYLEAMRRKLQPFMPTSPEYQERIRRGLKSFTHAPSPAASSSSEPAPKPVNDHSPLLASLQQMINEKQYTKLGDLRKNPTISEIIDKLEEEVPEQKIIPLLARLFHQQPTVYQLLKSTMQPTPKPGSSSGTFFKQKPDPIASVIASVFSTLQDDKASYNQYQRFSANPYLFDIIQRVSTPGIPLEARSEALELFFERAKYERNPIGAAFRQSLYELTVTMDKVLQGAGINRSWCDLCDKPEYASLLEKHSGARWNILMAYGKSGLDAEPAPESRPPVS